MSARVNGHSKMMSEPKYAILRYGNQEIVRVNFDPPSIDLAPGVEWDSASKLFWNSVCQVVGRPVLFPESN